MKKYIKPTVTSNEFEVISMIAESPGVTIDPSNPGIDPGGVDSKERKDTKGDDAWSNGLW